jgi:MYXO-CTERM domain-containing protein
MGFRSLVLFPVIAAAFTLAPSALADVPPGTGGSHTTTTAAGAGGAAGTNCVVSVEMTAGRTCMQCDPTTNACSSLGSDYHMVCQSSATAAIYCNGPNGQVPMDQNVACSVSLPGGSWRGTVAGGVLVAAAAALLRRRRRPS